jgi:hypothetical protein
VPEAGVGMSADAAGTSACATSLMLIFYTMSAEVIHSRLVATLKTA